jgi:phosphoribosylformylglycinamidine cyclo-ligase
MTASNPPKTYAEAGVDYSKMDPFKRMAQHAALSTAPMLKQHGATELSWSRGESAYLVQIPGGLIMGSVIEGLGTKNLVADAMQAMTNKTYYEYIAQDTVAMIVNDLLTLGILPWVVNMHIASGTDNWFTESERTNALVNGWTKACNLAGAAWGGGESPALKGIVLPETCLLCGSAVGFSQERHILRSDYIEDGDAIVLLESSGIHANGLTLARRIAEEQLPEGYRTRLSDGRMFGEALLDPTLIYSTVIKHAIQLVGGKARSLNYAAHITGHGWRKLMRADQNFEYVIEKIPEPQPVFRLIQEATGMDDKEAYATYNMGAGFALYMPFRLAQGVVDIAHRNSLTAMIAGRVHKSDRKRVVIRPLDITYEADDLQVR